MIRFRREISTAMKAASAPSRNAGAAACEITCDSWLTDGVSGIIGSVPRDARKIGTDRHCPEGLMVLRSSTPRTSSQSSVFSFGAWYRSSLGDGISYFEPMRRVGVTVLVGAIGKIANVSQTLRPP